MDGALRHGLAPGARCDACHVTQREGQRFIFLDFRIKSGLYQRRNVMSCY
jgi:hypothetical protein